MTPTELRSYLRAFRISVRAAAERWGVHRRTIEKWLYGERPIPPLVEHLLRLEAGQEQPLSREGKK